MMDIWTEVRTGDVVKLTGKTARLKQVIREHGKFWRVDGRSHGLICFGGEAGIHVVSLDRRHSRWIAPSVASIGKGE